MGSGKAAIGRSLLLGVGLLLGTAVRPVHASDLKPESIRAFDGYVQLLETRMEDDQANGNFLYIDRLPEDTRKQLYSQLRRGDPYIEQIPVEENGAPFPVPSGQIHHWVGVEFIPGANYSQTLEILLDFNKQAEIYKPDIQKSKLLLVQGNRSKVYLQYLKKSLVTVVLNANFDSVYIPVSPTRGEIRSYSTRIAEVEHAGEPDETELPVGKDHGYLWRLNSYWRLEEKDGGVYVQMESVALSRRIPGAIAWMIGPVVRKLSRAVIHNLLAGTCKAVKTGAFSAGPNSGNDVQGCAVPMETHDPATQK